MHRPAPSSTSLLRIGLRFFGRFGRLTAAGLLVAQMLAATNPPPPAKDEFSSLVKLAPFVVSGKSLAVSIYARTRSDRRYGEEFSEEVIKVVYEAVTESTGKGLVIIGAKGEPHPIVMFRKFLALAKDGKLDPEIAARAPELTTMLDHWQEVTDRKSRHGSTHGEGPDLDFEKILEAMPLPLEGVGAKLYQLAWEEKFDDAKVEARLCALRAGDLERRDLFKSFDWVFYLPPKGAFDHALDEVIAEALKKEKDIGFFARTAIKGVLLVIKPKIRRAIEGLRQGLMLMTVVRAQTAYTKREASDLMGAYVEVFVPFEEKRKKFEGDTDHERAVNAVREKVRRIAEKAQPASAPATPEVEKHDASN